MNECKDIPTDNTSEVTYQHTVEMLKYYQDEYFRRHTHLWSTLKAFFVLNMAISLLPFVSGIIGIEITSGSLPIYIFPIVGLFVAFVSFYILKKEVISFNLVAMKKRKLAQELPKAYQYINLSELKAATIQPQKQRKCIFKRKKNKKPLSEADAALKKVMSYQLILINLAFQITIALMAFVFCIL